MIVADSVVFQCEAAPSEQKTEPMTSLALRRDGYTHKHPPFRPSTASMPSQIWAEDDADLAVVLRPREMNFQQKILDESNKSFGISTSDHGTAK